MGARRWRLVTASGRAQMNIEIVQEFFYLFYSEMAFLVLEILFVVSLFLTLTTVFRGVFGDRN
jgi:hypothetical protein